MDIRALGYIGLSVADTDAWRTYASLLGTMVVATEGHDGFRVKTDDRAFRIIVDRSDSTEGLAFAGWEVADSAALDRAGAELEGAGCAVHVATDAECLARSVRGLLRTTDPGGFELEFFQGPILDHELFVSPTGVSRFVTEGTGLGHIVLGTPHLADSIAFYTQVLGFRVSDYMAAGADDIVFLHCNPRHHSLALVAAAEPALYHFMLEVGTVDDVGHTLDRHYEHDVPISLGLGRHTNDKMLSFYSRSPSGFDVEYGHGGILIDDATWGVSEITKPSLWGHRPPVAS